MQSIIIILACLAMLLAGLLGITLSVPLQAPAVILFGVAAIIAGFSQLRSQKEDGRQKTTDKSGTNWLLALVLLSIVYFVGRAWFSPVFDLGVEDLMLILPASILYLIGGYSLRGKSGVHLRVGVAIAVIVLLLLHIGSCALQLKGGEGYSLTPFFTGAVRSSEGHVTGMYGYYGSFANFAVIAGLLSLSLGVWGRMSFVSRGTLLLLGVMALSFAVYSQSRSALVSLVPAFFVFAVLLLLSVRRQSSGIRKWVRGGAIGFSLLVLLAGVVGGAWVFQNRAQPQDESVTFIELIFDGGVRMPYWSMAGEQWIEHPVTGAGSRSFSYLSYIYWSPSLGTNEANPEFVHNEYLQLLADYGLLGLILILVLLVWHFSLGIKQVRLLVDKIAKDSFLQGSNAMALAIAGLSGMTAMAVHVCFDFRTHLLANLLLLVCCVIWTLPVVRFKVRKCGNKEVRELNDVEGTQQVKGQKSSRGRDGRSWGLALVLLALGLGSVGLGGLQLWAGGPLLQNQMAKEDGAWIPQNVDRDVWIPALEESLRRAPQWKRFQRLGALYRLGVNDAIDPKERRQKLLESEQAYLNSLARHPYNPIPRINLAAIYTQQKRWREAEAMYVSASEMAKAREWWFRLPVRWADMYRVRAGFCWKSGDYDQAEFNYTKARHIIGGAKVNNGDTTSMYLMILIEQVRMYDSIHAYVKSDILLEVAESKLPNYAINSLDQNIRREMGEHYLRKGKYLWHKRQVEEAHEALLKAKKCFHIHQIVLKGREDEQWRNAYDEVKEILKFMGLAGIGN